MKWTSAHTRMATRLLLVGFCLWAYYSKVDMRDILTLATLLAGDTLMQATKKE